MIVSSVASILVYISGWLSGQPELHLEGPSVVSPPQLQFELRHLHAVSADPSPRIVFADVQRHELQSSPSFLVDTTGTTKFSYDINTRSTKVQKPSSFEAYSNARMRSLRFRESEPVIWQDDETPGPDVENRLTLLELAKMTNNAYVDPDDPQWYDIGNWTSSYPFGWEPDADGFRGHVFATPDNSTVVISIKGTSAGLFGRGGPTAAKDKLNDNLLFSCCCARVDWTWTTVCNCYGGGWKCDNTCVQNALIEESLFYPIGTNLFNNITYMYPNSNIWVIGHSLGGALASLVGVTFGLPVVTFESPGERMAATRLHLPLPPSTHHVTHVYHTADPIPMGTCNGVLSSCALGGYAMESRCHLGKSIIYDTVSDAAWAVDVRTHGIVTIIERLLSDPWPPSEEAGRQVPVPAPENDCVECYSWEFEN
ncbi:alpha/beta-hydrolase [Crepidotus variabilis]|uniref:triacylglycerol lipase n=1 Tax=Crepidotus variabilis TaxID=179855 RepID=A0A9P6JMR0_9AGAR|nr:alpha/beta-hydrolase [Crepidotus variabilis]